MSEEKIIKHTKKAVAVLEDKKISYKEKIKGFLEEIAVIIVAVSITLLFHNWNDERHENAIARNFLTGLKSDLKASAEDLEGSITDFQPTIDYYNKVLQQIKSHKIDVPYVDTLSYNLRNTSYFVFDDSRFEGFKSSGYLRLIKNQQLLKEIVTMYAIELPFEKETDASFFRQRQLAFDQYIGTKAEVDGSDNFIVSPLLNDKAVRFQFFNYAQIFEERKRHRQRMIKKMLALSKDIDKDLQK